MEIKVMSDVFYGKTMENLRSRVDVRLIRTKNIIWNGHQNQVMSHKK